MVNILAFFPKNVKLEWNGKTANQAEPTARQRAQLTFSYVAKRSRENGNRLQVCLWAASGPAHLDGPGCPSAPPTLERFKLAGEVPCGRLAWTGAAERRRG